MKKIYKRVISFLMWIFSNLSSFLIFMLAINIINFRMLKAGYLDGGGNIQFAKVYFGIPLLILITIFWFGTALFTYDYYNEGVEKGSLIKRFSLVTTIEMYLYPTTIFIYQVAFPIKMLTMDWIILSGGLVLGTISLYIYRVNKS
ncbi:MAG: hypothetical protein ACQEP9_01145 [Bacillota bacterium]